ncbi:MAG: hypothetical protein ACD_23C00684G0003 [uncultured bacterium]|nr:MAG: hypothetical protein ACD_23C00684G0003 [uncultured bacterium]
MHPDGPRLLGTSAIRAAFESIFSHGVLRANTLPVHRGLALAGAVHRVVEPLEITLPDGVHRHTSWRPIAITIHPKGGAWGSTMPVRGGAQDAQDLSDG